MADAPQTAPSPLTIGRYQVTGVLGHGGMGIVYLARDPSLQRFVAIKLMASGFEAKETRDRFVREAHAGASLRHPCIVTLLDYGDHDGQPFFVMEYVNGKTLAALIAERAPMSLVRRLHLIEDLCRGVGYAHRAGIIHRDIKPANIMVDGEGTLKILDFGIAKRWGTMQPLSNSTPETLLVGTPRYMSPEQIAGKPVTSRSDIFSVGLVAYELLAQRPAFMDANQYAVIYAIVNHVPPALEEQVPDLDPRIIRIVNKALEKDPDRRYQDLAQMRRDIAPILHRLALDEAPPSNEDDETVALAQPMGSAAPLTPFPVTPLPETLVRVTPLPVAPLPVTPLPATPPPTPPPAPSPAHAVAPALSPEPTPVAAPPDLFGLHNVAGFLPGPVRARRPKPFRTPVRFLDLERGIRSGTREWLGDEIFVGAKQGHDGFGFSVSVLVHLSVAIATISVILARPEILLPPHQPPIEMLAAFTPPPPQPATPAPQPKPIARVSPQVTPSLDVAPVVEPPVIPRGDAIQTPIVEQPIVTDRGLTGIQAFGKVDGIEGPPPKALVGGNPGIIDEVPVEDYDQDPALIKKVLPKVPVGASGIVQVELTVLANGSVSRVRVLTKTPFEALIVAAAQECLFRPARRRGKPVAVLATLEYDLETKK